MSRDRPDQSNSRRFIRGTTFSFFIFLTSRVDVPGRGRDPLRACFQKSWDIFRNFQPRASSRPVSRIAYPLIVHFCRETKEPKSRPTYQTGRQEFLLLSRYAMIRTYGCDCRRDFCLSRSITRKSRNRSNSGRTERNSTESNRNSQRAR
jgi:hypothetical protein